MYFRQFRIGVLATLPYGIASLLLTLPIKAVCLYVFTLLKDSAFRNSIRYFLNLVLWPLLTIIYAIVAFATLPWMWALLLTVLLPPMPVMAHEVWRLVRLAGSDIRLLANGHLRRKYQQIRDMILKLNT
ncbi:MAG: hypothetical protein IJX21_04870 [Alistipes sp.]|nr:hypothetical protein [Alistipes sp.]